MEMYWRDRDQVRGCEDWFGKIASKDYAEGRSALSLAQAWCGPIALAGVLSLHPDLGAFNPARGVVEAQTQFDEFTGPRNHDLLLVGDAAGGRTVVSIEAKADEPSAQSIGTYRKDAEAKRSRGESTNAPERLEGLLAALAPDVDSPDERLASLRYQLFSGVAGAVAAAVDENAVQAVFLIHEFVTDQTESEKRKINEKDLQAFMALVFGQNKRVVWTPSTLSLQAASLCRRNGSSQV